MAISELLDLSDQIRELILARRSSAEIKRAAREEGMIFLRESAVNKALAGPHHPAGDQQGHLRGGGVSGLPPALERAGATSVRRQLLEPEAPLLAVEVRPPGLGVVRLAAARAAAASWPRPPRSSCPPGLLTSR